MQFGVHERLILLAAIELSAPQIGSLITMRIVHDLRMALGFLETEVAEKEIVIHEDGRATWNESAPIDVDVGPVAHGIIHDGLEKALPIWDANEAITVVHISLFDKFDVDMDQQVEDVEDKE